METLPNLYFAGFSSRLGNSSKKKIYMVKAARSRHRIEVTTRSDTGTKRKLLGQETRCRDREKS